MTIIDLVNLLEDKTVLSCVYEKGLYSIGGGFDRCNFKNHPRWYG
jgi:hypothetical protein